MGIVAHVFHRYRPDAGSEVGRLKHRGVACDLSDFGGRSHAELPPTSALLHFMRFQKIVEQRFSEWSQVDAYAKHLACTERSLTRATTKAVNMSAKAFISARINLEAKRLLAHTGLPVSVIAERLCFEEATHFSKFFKRNTGCTPTEFRLRAMQPNL
jgi:AraC-like DNA-binding protein